MKRKALVGTTVGNSVKFGAPAISDLEYAQDFAPNLALEASVQGDIVEAAGESIPGEGRFYNFLARQERGS